MLVRSALVACHLVICAVASSPRSDYTGQIIQPDVQTHWGAWGNIQWCEQDTFAERFNLFIRPPQGAFEDTGLEGIGLLCVQVKCKGSSRRNPSWIYSSHGNIGDWSKEDSICNHGYYLAGAQARSESPQGSSDDTAANSYRFRCRHLTNSSSYDLHGHDGHWGSWSTWKSCPVGTAICGIQTQYEGESGWKDTTGINDAKFFCCKLPDPCIIF